MKKFNIKLWSLLGLMVLLGSCEDETSEGISKITTYADITIEGEETMYLNVGDEYVEPGAITSTGAPVEITGNVDVNTPGVYQVSYAAVNEDGFASNEVRTVYVSNTGDLVTSIEGLYYGNVTRVDPAETWEDLVYIRIWKTGENTYEITDALGGFYSLGRAYGDLYSGSGAEIVDEGGGSYSVSDGYVEGFGDDVVVSAFSVDPDTKTITFNSVFSGYTFKVTLHQYEF